MQRRSYHSFFIILVSITCSAFLSSCATSYKAQPVPFELPENYPNAQNVEGAVVGAQAYTNKEVTEKAFGFDAIDAGLLPIEVVFDNRGDAPLTINPSQTFLENDEGKLWPVLNNQFAYDRVTKYAQTKKIFKEGAYSGFLGGVAGALIGAAVGVVSGQNVAESAGQGAAVGAAGGAVAGGSNAYASSEQAKQQVMQDFQNKSLQNKSVQPGNLAYGFIFFPSEAKTAKSLRLQLINEKTKKPITLTFILSHK